MQKIFKLIQVIIVLLLIFVLIDNIDLKNFLNKFDIDFIYGILIAQIPTGIALYFTALRHHYFVHNDKLSKKTAFFAILIGSGFNNILPGRISELIKASYIRKQCGISFSVGIGAVFLERFIDVIFLFILTVISITLFSFNVNINTMLLITVALILFVYVLFRYEENILRTINKYITHTLIKNFFNSLLVHIRSQVTKKKIFYGICYGFLIWIFSILSVGSLLNIAGDITLTYTQIITLVVAGAIGYAIPALPGGLGTFEAIMVMMLMKYGYDFDTSIALSIGLRLSNIVIILPISLFLSMKYGTGLSKILKDLKNKDKITNDIS